MVSRGNTRHGDAKTNRSNLGAVEEICAQKANGNEEVEEEDEKNADDLGCVVGMGEGSRDCQSHHATSHSSTTDHQREAATKPVNSEERHKTGNKLPCQSSS